MTHGMSYSREYRIWWTMLRRCGDRGFKGFAKYGAKGISVCERWKSFENFYADMGPQPSDAHSIDRFPDKSGNYEPGNCRWATRKEQQRNMKSNRMLTLNGETMCATAWCERLGVPKSLLRGRTKRGWSDAEALLTPPVPRNMRKKAIRVSG